MTRPETFTKSKEPFEFMHQARQIVADYVSKRRGTPYGEENLSIIWFTTQGEEWRVLIGPTPPDGLYYRVAKNSVETRLDVFETSDSIIIEPEN